MKDNVYSWIITIFIPINSILNPVIIIYAEITKRYRKNRIKKMNQQ